MYELIVLPSRNTWIMYLYICEVWEQGSLTSREEPTASGTAGLNSGWKCVDISETSTDESMYILSTTTTKGEFRKEAINLQTQLRYIHFTETSPSQPSNISVAYPTTSPTHTRPFHLYSTLTSAIRPSTRSRTPRLPRKGRR